MKTTKSRVPKISASIIASLIFAGVFSAAAAENADALAILKASGRNQGFCVVLGCGSRTKPSLPADIAASSQMLVHGIASDNESLIRANAVIEKAGLSGRCSAEMIPVSPLPYAPDLANLVVIEDLAALKKQGVTVSDVLKIAAPGGVVCVFENGKWQSQVKPRPSEMGDWMQPAANAGANRISHDSLANFPAGVRWLDDIPMNFINYGWASCRAMVTAGNRCFTLSPTEFENLDPARSSFKSDLWLTAHDAFNGLPLWKINCGIDAQALAVNIRNSGPLVTDGTCVYTYTKNGLIAADIVTGKILRTMPVNFPTVRLVLSDGVLVSAGWADMFCSGLWSFWQPKSHQGSAQAFEAKTGKPLWEKPVAVQDLLADKGTAFLLKSGTAESDAPELEAVNLNTGKELWKVGAAEFANGQQPSLCLAADGIVAVCHVIPGGDPKKPEGAVAIFSAADGHKLWEQTQLPASLPGISIQIVSVQGALWMQGLAFDCKTGKPLTNLPRVGVGMCVPTTVIDDGRMVINGRGMAISMRQPGDQVYKQISYNALRGQCVQGLVPANGMFYVAQNNCCCTPDCLPGVIGFGSVPAIPADAEFQAARPLEKGPAFSAAMAETDGTGDWPMFLHDETRDSISPAQLPGELTVRWQKPVAAEPSGPLATAWASRLRSTLTAPVVAGKTVVTAAIEEGRVIALDAESGTVLWKFDAGARIDSSPTLYRGRCFFGSRNGWLYALDLASGKLAWRLRAAPLERRLVAFGQVESAWPALGSVLAHDGVIYATAGLNSETDGGLAVLAVDAKTGEQLWARRIGEGFVRSNDLLEFVDGGVLLRDCRLDPKTGEGTWPQAKWPQPMPQRKGSGLEGLMDEGWTKTYQRRSGGYIFGPNLRANLRLCNAETMFGPDFAINKEAAQEATSETLKKPETYLWKTTSNETRPLALAMTPNALVYAGKNIQNDHVSGYVQLVNPADGSILSQTALPAPVIHQGIAIAHNQIFVSLSNGAVACLGRKP